MVFISFVDNSIASNSARNSSDRVVQLKQDLAFYEEDGGNNHIPYVIFKCTPTDYYTTYVYNTDSISHREYYLVHW